jgi:hypothetical protein
MEPLVRMAKEDLAQRLDIQVEDIQVLEARGVVWPDASMGCPQPGMAYIQVPQDGSLIRLSAGGQNYDYHSGGNRMPFLCELSPTGKDTPPGIDLTTPPGLAGE